MPQITDIVYRPHYRVDLYIDPLLESIACLGALKEEENDPDWQEWISQVHAAMGDDLLAELDDLYSRFYQLRFLMDLGPFCALSKRSGRTLTVCDFYTSIDRLRNVSDNDFVLYMLGLEVEQPAAYTADILADPDYALSRMRAVYGPIMEEDALQEIVQQPAQLRERCVRFLENFWDRYFSREWEMITNYITRIAQREENRLVLTDIAALLSQDIEHVTRIGVNRFIFDDQKAFPIDLERLQEVHFFLSSYLGKRLSYNILPNELILALYVPLEEEAVMEPPEEVFRTVKGLGDQQRLKIMRYLWDKEATTSQLADLLSLAESTVSVHLKILKEADLVQSSRRGKNVFYTADRKAMATFNLALKEYIED